MGISGIGPGSLLLILAIILLIFGTKKLRNLGGDLGGAVKGFKKAMDDEDSSQKKEPIEQNAEDEQDPVNRAHNTPHKEKQD